MKPYSLSSIVTALLCLAVGVISFAQGAPSDLPPETEFAGDVSYVKDAHERQKLDIAFSKTGEPRPLLVWIHGGAYMGGDKAENHAVWADLMKSGYAVATINYRLSGDAKWPAQITDCKAAIRFLRAHAKDYNISPGRIAVWGSSAGGHLAALVGASGAAKKLDVGEYLDQSSTVSCAVDMFGPIDFEKMPQFKSPDSPEARMWGRATSEALDLAREACPITYLSKDTPPILVFHGDADGVVNISQSQLFDAAMKKAGAPGEFITLPGVGHSHEAVWMKERERIMNFFKLHLSGDVSAPTVSSEIETLMVEDGGTGPLKSLMAQDSSLPTHTIFRPSDMNAVGKSGGRLPIVVWGNGACANSPWEHVNFLSEIASHGFLVIAIGPMPTEDQPRGGGGRGPTKASLMTDAINWAIAQNANASSQYADKLDITKIAVAGMSCGGLQALETAPDPRVSTVMVCNSGIFIHPRGAMGGMPNLTKDQLKKLHTPVIYILGGKKDIAYENGMDDFKQIAGLPAFAANLEVGHGGTYAQPHGGDFAKVATAWLQWQLKGDRTAAAMFEGESCGVSKMEGWKVEKKNFR